MLLFPTGVLDGTRYSQHRGNIEASLIFFFFFIFIVVVVVVVIVDAAVVHRI